MQKTKGLRNKKIQPVRARSLSDRSFDLAHPGIAPPMAIRPALCAMKRRHRETGNNKDSIESCWHLSSIYR